LSTHVFTSLRIYRLVRLLLLKRISFLKKLDAVVGPLCARLLATRSVGKQVDLASVRRVLFIRPGGIGDAVLLVPAINAFCAQYPLATVEILAEKRNAGVFELCPQVARVFCYDCWREWPRLFSRNYDLIIDTEQWYYLSAVIARLVRAPIRCGFATNSRQQLFTHTVAYSHRSYEVDSFISLLNNVSGEELIPPAAPYLHWHANVASSCAVLMRPIAGQAYAVLFAGASIPERRWSCVSFKKLAQLFNRQGVCVVVVGGREDAAIGAHIVADIDLLHGINLAGKTTLAETAAILAGAKLLVSGDSGVLHLAAGVGCPTVSLFGPGIEEKWAPRGDEHHVVNLGLPCSPCTRFGTTPKCYKHGQCIQDISVEMVWDQVKPLLVEDV